MKKTEIIFIGIIIVLAGVVFLSVLFLPGKKTQPSPKPIQVFSPAPSTIPKQIINQGLEAEKQVQENYAQDRADFLSSKPWILQLPLKGSNYFISYNPENDTLVAELYYLENGVDKNIQLLQAKQDAQNAMTVAGVDINTQKIQYLEELETQ